ncbi:MAG: hypothetical protein KC636_21125 [Myxococcales bacterium]|nr:hypothetical protein [Myxococcales bacterium]
MIGGSASAERMECEPEIPAPAGPGGVVTNRPPDRVDPSLLVHGGRSDRPLGRLPSPTSVGRRSP